MYTYHFIHVFIYGHLAFGYILALSFCLIYPLFIIWWLSLSPVIIFSWKCILPDTSIATLAFFRLPFTWTIFFHHFTLCPWMSLKWVSCRLFITRFFKIGIATTSLFIEEFTPFTFQVIIDRWCILYESTIDFFMLAQGLPKVY